MKQDRVRDLGRHRARGACSGRFSGPRPAPRRPELPPALGRHPADMGAPLGSSPLCAGPCEEVGCTGDGEGGGLGGLLGTSPGPCWPRPEYERE